MTEISIVILTKNAGRKFKKILAAVFEQKIDKEFEVIIIDSGSQDKTLKTAKKFKIAKTLEIQPAEFNFGKTKNLALTLCQGKYIVFLSQDAFPQNEWWLKNLIQPLEQKVSSEALAKGEVDAAGVFSRQIPYKHTNLFQRYAVSYLYPEKEKNNVLGDIFFSNVSSAIKREVLEKIKFPENIPMSEDQAWAKMALAAGYKIIYAPDSIVFHSHNYSFWKNFKRNFDSGLSLKKLDLINPVRNSYGGLRSPQELFQEATHVVERRGIISNGINKKTLWDSGLKYLLGEIAFLFWKRNVFFVLYLPDLFIYEGFRVLGFWLGTHYKWLPLSWRKRFSLFKKNLE